MWDDEAGYDRTDPKHRSWRDGMATAADMRRKAARENPPTYQQQGTIAPTTATACDVVVLADASDPVTEATNAALKAIGEARAAVDELEKALKDAWPW